MKKVMFLVLSLALAHTTLLAGATLEETKKIILDTINDERKFKKKQTRTVYGDITSTDTLSSFRFYDECKLEIKIKTEYNTLKTYELDLTIHKLHPLYFFRYNEMVFRGDGIKVGTEVKNKATIHMGFTGKETQKKMFSAFADLNLGCEYRHLNLQ